MLQVIITWWRHWGEENGEERNRELVEIQTLERRKQTCHSASWARAMMDGSDITEDNLMTETRRDHCSYKIENKHKHSGPSVASPVGRRQQPSSKIANSPSSEPAAHFWHLQRVGAHSQQLDRPLTGQRASDPSATSPVGRRPKPAAEQLDSQLTGQRASGQSAASSQVGTHSQQPSSWLAHSPSSEPSAHQRHLQWVDAHSPRLSSWIAP